jgi:serine/threonine protein kinase
MDMRLDRVVAIKLLWHRRGIIHRNVMHGNVMLTKAGAKLLDIGLAKSDPLLEAACRPRPSLATTRPSWRCR